MRKKHEIVESVILSICQVFEIEDWRSLLHKLQNHKNPIAKYFVVNLLSSEMGCSFQDVHNYFPVYNNRSTYSACQTRLMDALEFSSTKRKYIKAKTLIKRYFLLKPDTYDVLIVQ